MKRIPPLIILILFFLSCSKDETATNPPEPIVKFNFNYKSYEYKGSYIPPPNSNDTAVVAQLVYSTDPYFFPTGGGGIILFGGKKRFNALTNYIALTITSDTFLKVGTYKYQSPNFYNSRVSIDGIGICPVKSGTFVTVNVLNATNKYYSGTFEGDFDSGAPNALHLSGTFYGLKRKGE